MPEGLNAPADVEADDSRVVCWRIHCAAPPSRAFLALINPEEQAKYWCERSTHSRAGYVQEFIDGTIAECQVVQRRDAELLVIRYFSSLVEFKLEPAGTGTDLTLTATEIPPEEWLEVYAGWLNVLLPLKAWLDYGVDIRNHDPSRTWRQRFVDQ